MRVYNLCLLGFGNVGRALVPLLVEKSGEMRGRYGVGWRVTGVATRRMGWLAAPEGFGVEELTSGVLRQRAGPAPSNVGEWLEAAGCDVLFETTSLEPLAGEPAVTHARAALERGAHVVTANKGIVVHAFRELKELARARGRRLLFESTVADCLPVFSLFREALPAARVLGFTGLLNSTTTVVLEEMGGGRTFEEAVGRAQALGVAETDPTNDLEGWDAAVKVCALANVLMGADLRPRDLSVEGVTRLAPEEVRRAHASGKPYRLLASARRDEAGNVKAGVRPEMLSPSHPFAAAARGTSLVINFELDVLPGLTLVARDPSLRSTAYGLLADFINATKEEPGP
jgi:homoserine dehydrogenase